ncbi:ABC transporter permease [Nonomuraea sp. KC401]|uniref:ABC transporter permease n=1 Tax=unclassified Nonomuraea TaxID=2593643 RepID=UPI0010FEB9D1|nr:MULTISPECIES: ABC transporter permease [unclassified Nonomuraea]NBE92459.1 ABC transporter permease [Nonomuraea sp. K271]TLF84842.1 ABC transporter permease [Nonomuraea sp. KC401]
MIRHTVLFTGYELKKSFSNPIWPLFGMIQPVLYLLMFAPLLKTMTPGGTTTDALRMFTPAAMMMIAVFGSLFSGFGLIAELRNGSLERYAVSPAWRPAIVLGRVAKDMVVLVCQAILVLVVAMAMGVRIGVVELVLVLLLMAATGLFASGLSQGLALTVRDENGMSQTLNLFMLPIMLLAGLFVPISFAPDWMKTLAPVNPLYHAVEAGRALFAGRLSDSSIPVAFGLFLVLAVLTTIWSMRSLRRIAG